VSEAVGRRRNTQALTDADTELAKGSREREGVEKIVRLHLWLANRSRNWLAENVEGKKGLGRASV
jgi:hypothetical protein